MKKILSVLAFGLFSSSAFAEGGLIGTNATTQAYLNLKCFAEIINLADEFEVPYDTALSGTHAEGAPQSAYSNRSAIDSKGESFQLNSTCPVTVTAVPVDTDLVRLTSLTGKFEHATKPGFEISLASLHNDAKVYLDGDTAPLNTAVTDPASPHSSAHDIIAEVALGLDVSTPAAGALAAGRYNMNIELEIVENI